MNLAEIEAKVEAIDRAAGADLIYDLLLAYGLPKATISRLRNGSSNQSDRPDEVLLKGKVYDRYVSDHEVDLHGAIDELKAEPLAQRHRARFVIVRNDQNIVALDTRTSDSLDVPLEALHLHAAFFLPLAGIEKTQLESLNYADIKAAEKMARLYDEIIKANLLVSEEDFRRLNIFFSRLLFCFFAEDTEVFEAGSFTNVIASSTSAGGEDTAELLDALFAVLDTAPGDREGVPSHFASFGYVNGKLFSSDSPAPRFTAKARQLVLDCGTLDWSQINPDIFGSMIQAVVHPGQRESLGMHYTSVENIMKVIRPLFLDSLEQEFEAAETLPRLRRLRDRVAGVRAFDPACGSGNFLVIAYKELRKLEHRILLKIRDLDPRAATLFTYSEIKLENFYGIEIDDFAHEIAVLSLWLAKHQMNVEFKELFGAEIKLIPLTDTGQIVCANATRVDWEQICPKVDRGETYVLGNPPYYGSKKQSAEHKADLASYFRGRSYSKDLDYISIWFLKASEYVADGRADAALVSTNSVCQGKHVGLLWPGVYARGVEISFAYQSFKWTNQAKRNAGVTVVVVGLSARPGSSRVLVVGEHARRVQNIGPYLLATADNMIVEQRRTPLALLPAMVFGSMPRDGGGLVLTESEVRSILDDAPAAARYIRKYVGTDELLKGTHRHCLWVDESQARDAAGVPALRRRFEIVRRAREDSPAESTKAAAATPWRFVQRAHQPGTAIIVPGASSERREIIPMGFVDEATVVSNLAYVIYGGPPWLFALLQSRMHTAWVGTVSGRMKTDYRYSKSLAYNTFPVQSLSAAQKARLTEHAFAILQAREFHSDKALGDLYFPDKMPANLRAAHEELDATVDAFYSRHTGLTNEQRLEILFAVYDDMIASEAEAA